MNPNRISDRSRPGLPELLVDENDAVGQVSLEPKSIARYHLLPGEEAASLPQSSLSDQCTMAPLTRFLGLQLTAANPVWSGDPVPRMRALQKKLIEHSLTLEPDDRRECLDAITVVETDLQWRLRLQQMRMTEGEMSLDPDMLGAKSEKPKGKSRREQEEDPED